MNFTTTDLKSNSNKYDDVEMYDFGRRHCCMHTNNYQTQDRNMNYPHPFESISYSPNNLGHCNKKTSRADHSFVQNNQSPHSHGSNHDNEDVLSFISSNATTKVY